MSTSFVCLALICLVLSSASHCSALIQENDSDLIERSCSMIVGYEECSAILRSDPRAIRATDVKELAYIILDLCIANATDTLEEIPKLQNLYSAHAQIKQALDNCGVAYQTSIKDYFGEAVKLLEAKSYQKAQYAAHIGGALGTSCEQEFYFQAPTFSPLWVRNHDLAVLGLVAEGIISLLRLNETEMKALSSVNHMQCFDSP